MKKNILSLIGIVVLLLTLTTTVFAWFVNSDDSNITIEGSSTSSYYESGNGTSDNPFIITRPKHLYNMAWLQNLGFYDDKTYYFELKEDIDMTDYDIPPIGIDGVGNKTSSHPFIGSFNGNSHTISNLCIKTNNFSEYPQIISNITTFDFGKYIGLFGYIDTKETDSGKSVGTLKNTYIDNIHIQGIAGQQCVGLVAGHVNGSLSRIGVCYSSISFPTGSTTLETRSNISDFTLVGSYDDSTIEWGDVPESGYSFGTTLDVAAFKRRMDKIIDNSNSDTPSSSLPTIEVTDDSYTLSSNQYMAASIEKEDDVYQGSSYKETVSSTNTGYFIGNNVKTYSISIPSDTNFYESTYASGIYNIVNDKVPDEIKNHVLNQEYLYALRLQSKVDVNNQLVTINDGVCGDYRGKIIVPRRCVWFVPQVSGTCKFVMYAKEDQANFSLYKISRSTPGDYSTSMTGYEWIDGNSPRQTSLKKSQLYYYEYELEAYCEYALANDRDGNGAYFCYLDLGMAGGGEKDLSIENVDFVFKTSTGYSDFTNKSNVFFEISEEALANVDLYIRRTETTVLYYLSSTSLSVNPIGTGANQKATNEECLS